MHLPGKLLPLLPAKANDGVDQQRLHDDEDYGRGPQYPDDENIALLPGNIALRRERILGIVCHTTTHQQRQKRSQ